MKPATFLFTLCVCAVTIVSTDPAHAELSRKDFLNPPLQARPSSLWAWLNGHVDHRQITRELEEMKDKGMRGGLIWDVGALVNPDNMIPAGPQFFGDESIASIHHAMDEADRLGLELGLFTSSSWNAGGTWITPKDASKALLWSEQKVTGPGEVSAILPLTEKVTEHYEDVAVLAVPEDGEHVLPDSGKALRLDRHLAPDGRLTWSVPEGSWRILRFLCNNTGEFLNCPSPNSRGLVIDHLSRDATDAHINHLLDRIAEGRDGYGPMTVFMLDILTRMSVKDGRIVLPDGMNYRMLVLPDREAISPAVLRRVSILYPTAPWSINPYYAAFAFRVVGFRAFGMPRMGA